MTTVSAGVGVHPNPMPSHWPEALWSGNSRCAQVTVNAGATHSIPTTQR
jgi:hypothetical protein